MAGAPPADESELVYPALPDRVVHVLATLDAAGHEAVLVGGSVRDRLLGLSHDGDWDVATSARPEQVAALFEGATWENRFGTVTIGANPAVEVTSYRTEGGYRDRRRPDEVRFGVSLADDLARRDFTINAVAWVPADLTARRGRVVDLHDGAADLASRRLRTVGDPRERFGEDALRLVRAARFAGRFALSIEAETEAAMRELAPSVASVSAERVRDELTRILRHEVPSRAFRILEATGLLHIILPEVAALRGIPQAKARPGDALDHTLAAVDAAVSASFGDGSPTAGGGSNFDDLDLGWAALLHDVGKAQTMGGGHFIDHDTVGAEMADAVLRRLRVATAHRTRVVGAIREHMYNYERAWTDAAVRRFIQRTSDVDRNLLFALRRVDNAASGTGEEGERNQRELEERIARELEGHGDLLLHRRLAVDGHDLQRELGMTPGPAVGRLLDRLAERVVDDPTLNDRATLLRVAEELLDPGDAAHHLGPGGSDLGG